MRKLLLLIIVLCSINLWASDYPFSINGKQYKIIETMKTWTDAATWAAQDGGYLVEINSASEQIGIYNAIVASGISTTYTVVNDGGGIAYIWIGATDKNVEGTWLWDGDNDGVGTNFYNGQGAWGTANGAAVSGAYINWGGANTGTTNEPDDYGSSQDAAGIGLAPWPASGMGNIAGEWNDIDKSNTLYFIVEYDATGINENTDPSIEINLVFYQDESGHINLQSDHVMKEVSIYNTEGKLVFFVDNIKLKSLNINANLCSGVYFIRSRFADYTIHSQKVFIR